MRKTAIRTDLAIDISETVREDIKGIEQTKQKLGKIEISKIKITSRYGEKRLSKPMGEYITIEFPSVELMSDYKELKEAVISSIKELTPKKSERILIVGLGNIDITPDSIGPRTAKSIFATRHIAGEVAQNIGLDGLRSVAVISPGVLGKTGIEVVELIAGAAERIKPDIIIAIDALASNSVKRLFKTIQLCNTGISPGSGVNNQRKEISRKTLNVPVIALGVPTVADAGALAFELTGKEPEQNAKMIVTSKDADLLCDRLGEIISQALNIFLQPEIDEDIILSLV